MFTVCTFLWSTKLSHAVLEWSTLVILVDTTQGTPYINGRALESAYQLYQGGDFPFTLVRTGGWCTEVIELTTTSLSKSVLSGCEARLSPKFLFVEKVFYESWFVAQLQHNVTSTSFSSCVVSQLISCFVSPRHGCRRESGVGDTNLRWFVRVGRSCQDIALVTGSFLVGRGRWWWNMCLVIRSNKFVCWWKKGVSCGSWC